MDDDDPRNRKQRRAARKKGHLDTAEFLKLADLFIDVANQQNKAVNATELHMAFLYGAARYNAHVAKNVLSVDDHEKFVGEMTRSYQEMLRNHLADPGV